MRQTVMGVYDSYADAFAAQRALTDAGFSQADISIYAVSLRDTSPSGPRVYAPGGGYLRHDKPVFDQLEQLFGRLFKQGEYPPETEDYREVIRRGGAILSADVSEVQVDLASDVMRRTGAVDIGDRAKVWRHASEISAQVESKAPRSVSQTSSAAASMKPSEPKLGDAPMQRPAFSTTGVPTASGVQEASLPTEGGAAVPATPATATGPGRPPSPDAAGLRPPSAPFGTGDGFRPVGQPPRDETASASQAQKPSGPDDFVDPIFGAPLDDDEPYDDEFRRGYDKRFAKSGASYDETRRPSTYPTTPGQDERYRGRESNPVGGSSRDNWEPHYTDNAWERFKSAVRHGWERVTERR